MKLVQRDSMVDKKKINNVRMETMLISDSHSAKKIGIYFLDLVYFFLSLFEKVI